MKRSFTILTAAFMLLAFLAIPMGMMGQTTESVTLSNGTFDTDHITWRCANNGITIQQLKGTSSTAVNSSYISAPRVYKGHVLSFVGSETCKIKEIDITYTGSYYGNSMTAGTEFSNNTVTDNTTDVARTWASTSGGTHVVSSVSDEGLSAIYIQNVASASNTQLRFTALSITYITSGTQPTTYTVTFNAGDGTFVGNTDFPNASNTVEAGTYTLPSAEKSGYTFDGWLATGSTTPVTGNYTVSSDVDFTAQYTQNIGSDVTATLTATNLELTGSYTTNTSITIDGITYVYTDLMKNNSNIQAKASTGTIKNTTAYPGDITSVAITHSGTARATTINGSADGTNWTQVATGSGSITADFSDKGYKYFQITRGSNAAYWEKIDITYSTSASSQSQSDLAITNASTDLTFDLYNNSSAQVINYTTSSTGAITITPASPTSYFSYVHNATAKTITVTPLAVTPIAQTVTISQEADDDYYAGNATFTVSVSNSDPNIPGTENNPYTVAQAIVNTPSNGNVYIQGVVSSFYNTSIVGDGNNFRYYISDDGTTTTQLLVYRGKGLDQATFANADDLLIGDEVVIYGSLVTYQNAPEVASGNYLTSWNRPTHDVETPTFSPAAGTYATTQIVTISCTTDNSQIFYTTDGTEPTNASTEYTAAITIENTTTIKAIAYVGSETSAIATATYHINSQTNPYTVDQALAFFEYPANGIYVHGVVSTAPTQNPTNNGELTYYISVDGKATNQLEVYKGKGLEQTAFTAKDDLQVGDIVTIYGNVQVYNGTIEFGSGNYLVSFERPSYTLNITGYGNSDGGYYLIASPVTMDPSTNGMTTGDYDLYTFNQAEKDEWRNYKTGAFTNLEPGKGYLYAHKTSGEFTLSGEAYTGDGAITLFKTEGGDFPGWNLVGNPFNTSAQINRDFYILNSTGDELIQSNGLIAPMQGIFVIATTNGETLTFEPVGGEPADPMPEDKKVVLNINSNTSTGSMTIDRAVVRFGEGRTLPKFQLNPDNTKVYFTEGNENFAVVRSANEGEMPVSFKASENGRYTISVNAENIEMEYLHLIDNMTGADVDLLATPSYSFEANTTDYTSRFRLMFSANNGISEQSNETFAFFNGGNWVVNNHGEATLQVIDMTGRVLSSEQINGNYNKSLNLNAGVYVLRLSNGNVVKTQKVVID